MSAVGFEALAVLIILLPGFLAARTVQALCVRPSQTELDKVVEALLYSFVTYVVYAVILKRFPLQIIHEALPNGSQQSTPQIHSFDLLILLGVSLLLALVASASITNDLHGRLFRFLRITKRTTRSSIWGDVFHDLSYYVQIQFADGRKVLGWPKYFSDTPEESSIFLENAAWVEKDGRLIDIPGPGILITRNMQIESIMFLSGEPIDSRSQ